MKWCSKIDLQDNNFYARISHLGERYRSFIEGISSFSVAHVHTHTHVEIRKCFSYWWIDSIFNEPKFDFNSHLRSISHFADDDNVCVCVLYSIFKIISLKMMATHTENVNKARRWSEPFHFFSEFMRRKWKFCGHCGWRWMKAIFISFIHL